MRTLKRTGRERTFRWAVRFGAIALGMACAGLPLRNVRAQDRPEGAKEEETPKHDLAAWGRLGSRLKKAPEFYEFTYYKTDERRRRKSFKAYLRIPEKLTPLVDRAVRFQQLKAGENVLLFGKPVSRLTPTPQGVTIRENRFENTLAVLAGKEIDANRKYKYRRDPAAKWCEAKVKDTARGFEVTYERASYRVLMAPRAPVILRMEGKQKLLRRGAYVYVEADKSEEAPPEEAKPDEKLKTYVAKKIVILDPRYIRTVYPMVLP